MSEKEIILSPSLLSCNFAKVGEELQILEENNVKFIHLDVMDGIFVPNISFGIPVIKSLRRSSKLVFDTHLMITEPERYINQFASAGSDYITIHYEATKNPESVLEMIRKLGKKAGISIKPGTSAEEIFHLLPLCDLVLVMTVEPGFGGQSFMHGMIPKIKTLRTELDRIKSTSLLSVDGGIDVSTAPLVIEAGANMIVAGSAVFGKEDIASACQNLMNL